MSVFRQTLKDYCMIVDEASAKKFIRYNLSCSKVRSDDFLGVVNEEFKQEGSAEKTRSIYRDAELTKDFIDSLRRSPYVGLGL